MSIRMLISLVTNCKPTYSKNFSLNGTSCELTFILVTHARSVRMRDGVVEDGGTVQEH